MNLLRLTNGQMAACRRLKKDKDVVAIYARMVLAANNNKGVMLSLADIRELLVGDNAVATAIEVAIASQLDSE